MSARNVATGGDDAPFAAANDQRFVAKGRIVPLLDCGVECVAVDVRDGKRVALGMSDKSRRTAAFASPGPCVRLLREAVPAEGGGGVHQSSPRGPESIC